MFTKVATLLENNDITKEIAEALDKEIGLELGKLREEAKTLRLEKETLSSNYDEVLKSKKELDIQLLGLDDKITQAKKDGQGDIAKKLEIEKQAQIELQKSLSSLEKANTTLRLDSAVSQELNKFDIKKEDRELVEFKLRSNVSLNDEGSSIYTDGNTTTTISEGFEDYFKANQSRLNPKGGNDGSGTTSGGGGGSQNTKTRSDFDKMNPGSKAKFMADGGKVI